MNSNLNPAPPFIILIMRHWSSPTAVKWLPGYKHTQSWCRNWQHIEQNFLPSSSKVSQRGPL
eukprot:scaffold13301_cov63-Cyclotella_meneghiniana.AAC.1